MKLFCTFFLLYVTFLNGQTVIKINTYDTINQKYFLPRLLDEREISTSVGFLEKRGYYNLKHSRLDSLKSYRLYLDDARFKKILIKLDLKKNDTLIVNLEPNPNCNCRKFPKNVFVKNCPFYDTWLYEPGKLRKIEDLPKNVSIKIKNHLVKKLGKTFYSKLYFKQANLIDNNLYDGYDKKSRYHYIVCFAFSNEIAGIGEYTATIELDDFASIYNDIKLPNNYKYINLFKSFDSVKKRAINQKHYIEGKTERDFDFDEKLNIFVWKFINNEHQGDGHFIQRVYIYSAHSGEFKDLVINKMQIIN